MTTSSREEAPERVQSERDKLIERFKLVRARMAFKSKTLLFLHASELDELLQAADLANREPSEGDVERIGRAVWAALSDSPLPDRDCQRAMEMAGLAAINAWRNP